MPINIILQMLKKENWANLAEKNSQPEVKITTVIRLS